MGISFPGEDKGPVDPVNPVSDDELDELQAEGELDVDFGEAGDEDVLDKNEEEDVPASDEVRAEAGGTD